MKFDWKKAAKIGVCVFLLFLCILYWQPFVAFIAKVLSAATPLVVGAFIAYIVNILMSRYESWFFPSKQSGVVVKIRRPLCMVFAILSLVALVSLVVWLVVPQLLSCIQVMVSFLRRLPDTIKELIGRAENWSFIPSSFVDSLAEIDWESRVGQLAAWITSGVGGVVNTVAKTVFGFVSGVITAIIGFIFSIYLLLEKDRLKRQLAKLADNYVSPRIYNKIFYVARVFNESFRRFIIGQFTEAVILGGLCTVGMLIFGMPYATMIGALIAFTALIPIAGAYIGAVTGALMILTVSPAKALGFIVFIIILQQLEGNIIYPKVVGSSLGLPGMWVLVAVTVGGGCFGVIGMLVGVPLMSAVYRIIREDIEARERKREILTSDDVSCGGHGGKT